MCDSQVARWPTCIRLGNNIYNGMSKSPREVWQYALQSIPREVHRCCRWWMVKRSGIINHHDGCSPRVYLTSRWVLPWEVNGRHLCWIRFCRVCVLGMPMRFERCGVWELFLCCLPTHSIFLCHARWLVSIWVVNYPLYIALTNGSSFFWRKKKNNWWPIRQLEGFMSLHAYAIIIYAFFFFFSQNQLSYMHAYIHYREHKIWQK